MLKKICDKCNGYKVFESAEEAKKWQMCIACGGIMFHEQFMPNPRQNKHGIYTKHKVEDLTISNLVAWLERIRADAQQIMEMGSEDDLEKFVGELSRMSITEDYR